MAAVRGRSQRASEPVGQYMMLLRLLIGNESFSRRARELTIAGGSRLHQSNKEIASRHSLFLSRFKWTCCGLVQRELGGPGNHFAFCMSSHHSVPHLIRRAA